MYCVSSIKCGAVRLQITESPECRGRVRGSRVRVEQNVIDTAVSCYKCF